MNRIHVATAFAFAALLLSALAVTTTQAAKERIEGYYRITLYSGTVVKGHVKERADGNYEVEVRKGIVMTIRKGEVRQIVRAHPPGEEPSQNPAVAANKPTGYDAIYHVTDAEIAAILTGIEAKRNEFDESIDADDLAGAIPLNKESVIDMLDQVGLDYDPDIPLTEHPNVLVKDHFVFVYTSTKDAARKLASRLEAVYRWNVKFMKMMDLPAKRPEYKLEVFFFAEHKDFTSYSLNQGTSMPTGVLGYYVETWNRSHFFDMHTWPYLDGANRMIKDPKTPWKKRQYYRNYVNRWVEFKNMEVVQHEAGHHIHFNIGLFPKGLRPQGGSIPTWLVEGTTMLFEFPVTAAGASLGVLNHYRLDQVRKFYGPRPLNTQFWKLFIIDNNMWQGGNSYPLGWALTYYLFKEHRDEYAAYLRDIFGREADVYMSHGDREKEFEQHFGRVDDEWIEDYHDFLESLHVKQSVLPPELF
jgi:hypothetical protein